MIKRNNQNYIYEYKLIVPQHFNHNVIIKIPLFRCSNVFPLQEVVRVLRDSVVF